ncbi:hypothetical protein NDU88_005406 [Pleurodeles waltl]|uniref:Uncharacterized protein n=1 Tax=Pleurodeles waltl TaxID=8319 RepID=A0AAV7LL04_PLEWA|nr:hypothetical protein NDU88_005406 [Pleurodeles waltl]
MMGSGFVEQALVLLRRAGRMDLVNQEALSALRPARRAAQGVAAAVLSERSGILQPGEPRAAQIPWREEQAEPSAAGRCASTGGQRKRAVTADASEGWCGNAGFAPDDAAILWEQHPGPSKLQRGKDRRHAGGEPTYELLLQGTRAAVFQGGDPWHAEEECVLDFDEGSVD